MVAAVPVRDLCPGQFMGKQVIIQARQSGGGKHPKLVFLDFLLFAEDDFPAVRTIHCRSDPAVSGLTCSTDMRMIPIG
jgi:hypothetical protein